MHGAFLQALARPGADGARAPLLVLLDEESYRARLGADGSERLAQRRRAWERLAREAGLRVASLPAGAAGRAARRSPRRAPPSPSTGGAQLR